VVVLAGILGGTADVARLAPSTWKGARGVLESAGFLFFAFAGYARIATLGEEIVDPARTIPRAILLALLLTLVVYAVVCVTTLVAVDAPSLAATPAPLVRVVTGGRFAALAPIVRVGAAVASLGVLLSLLAGVSRTAFAMAGNGDLPKRLDSVHPRYRVPDRAELVAGALVVIVVLATDVRAAIGASSFAVLVYYGIANASALTLREHERRFPRATAIVGVAGCALLAAMLPRHAVVVACAVLAAGAALYAGMRVAAR
jgi:APA family basic amino acid/polyamine antiporter